MTRYLLDTNILIRLSDSASPDQIMISDAVAQLITQGHECVVTSQVLIEFWVVATRPSNVNGLSWTIEQTSSAVSQLLTQFPPLPETEKIFTTWLELVTTYRVMGKRTHDLRLVAVMLTHQVTHLLTLNSRDFPSSLGVTIVQPQDFLNF